MAASVVRPVGLELGCALSRQEAAELAALLETGVEWTHAPWAEEIYEALTGAGVAPATLAQDSDKYVEFKRGE